MSWMNALSLGRQHAQEDRAIADQQRLGKLSAAALTASPDGRNKILGQVAAIDPNAAFGMRETFQREDANVDERTRGQLVFMAKTLAAAPEAMRGGLYSQMVEPLRRMGVQAPDVWQPDLMGVVQSLAGADQNAPRVQSTQVLENGEIAMFMSDGTVKRSGATAQSPFTVKEFRNPDGTVSYERIPTRSYGSGGTYGGAPQQAAPAQQSASPTPAMDEISAQATVLSQMGQPPELINEFIRRAAQARGVQLGEGGEVMDGIGAPSAVAPPVAPPSQSEMDRRANATLDRQTYSTPPAPRQGFGQTDAERAQAEADAAALKIRQEGLARDEVESMTGAGRAELRIGQIEQQYENISSSIQDALDLVKPTTTGFLGARMRGVEGSEAYDLGQAVLTVKANLGFDRLQEMRESSPTGGALGSVAQQELEALQSTLASMDANQSEDRLRSLLNKAQGHYDRWYETMIEHARKQAERGRSLRDGAQQPTQRLRYNAETGEFE